MRKFLDLSQQRFGRWTAEEFVGYRAPHQFWRCRCDCGSVAEVTSGSLRAGNSQSCGCLRRERVKAAVTTHGGAAADSIVRREYKIWATMISRCTNPRVDKYPCYGGRGITVCDRWRYGELSNSGFACFLADMGPKPFIRATIDRKNNDGPYEPSNCVWSDRRTQARNKSTNVPVILHGRDMMLVDALQELKVGRSSYYYLKRIGYSNQKAIDRLSGVYTGPPA